MRFNVAVVDLHSLIVAIIAAHVCRASAPLTVSINWQVAAATACPQIICLRLLRAKSEPMSDHIYKKIELVGSSPNGIEDAVKNALARAKKTVRNMRWFEVAETRGYLEEGSIAYWQVTLKVGFTLEG